MTTTEEASTPAPAKLGRRAFIGGGSAALVGGGGNARGADASGGDPHCRPPEFPSHIPLKQRRYRNWSLNIDVPRIWCARPEHAEDVAVLANWARDHGYRLRAVGHSHNWSPIVVTERASTCATLLVDTTALTGEPELHEGAFPAVTFGAGTSVEDATAFLESLDNEGRGAAPGYTFPAMTAPGKLTLGGVLAVGAHGTGVATVDDPSRLNGSLSHLVVGFEAVVTDPEAEDPDVYAVKWFDRTHPDASSFLVHLGRAFLTRVTLRVVPNFYLQVDNLYPLVERLFEAPVDPPSPDSIAAIVGDAGRVEVTWFPFTRRPWVKTWRLQPDRIEPQVPGPYNYPWQEVSLVLNAVFKLLLFSAPGLTPWFGWLAQTIAKSSARPGAALNGKSRDLLLYVEAETLRVTEFSYAIQLRREELQGAAHALFVRYNEMIERYRARGAYPVNGPFEMRFTGMDEADALGVPGARAPALSACRSGDPSDPELDTVLWFSILTIPGTPESNRFFRELETWMHWRWGRRGRDVLRPEWSKAWAYRSETGAWTHRRMLKRVIPRHFDQPDDDPVFERTRKTLAAYDKHHLFSNRFLDRLLPG